MRLTTERLELEPITADCVDDIVSVVRSNPTFLMLHHGSGEQAQPFDREVLKRDIFSANADPDLMPLVVRLRETRELVGWAELSVDHPRDRVPWVGLLELHADQHGRGLGREAAQALLDWARRSGATALRLGVDDGNDSAMVFWTPLGFVAVDRRTRAAPSGTLGVTVLEHAL
jgi:RimJ/RimL family protein N-acetyltransferase